MRTHTLDAINNQYFKSFEIYHQIKILKIYLFVGNLKIGISGRIINFLKCD